MEWIRRGLKMVIWKFGQKNGGKGDKYVDIHLVDELTEYVSQELDKAREEGRREAVEETNRTLGTNVKYIDGEYKVVFRRVSKLLKQ